MGNSQSSRASAKKINAPNVEHNLQSESARGRKSLPTSAAAAADHANTTTTTSSSTTNKDLSNVEVQLVSSTSSTADDASDDDAHESIGYQSDDEETDEEIDAGLAERRLILEDAAMLKQYATFHLHPEESIETTSPFAKGRNYFTRPSAPEQLTIEESQERARILEDAQQLKMYANFHLHPENPVEKTTDATATARNFFSRASAPEQETLEEAEERVKILEEVAILKKYAEFHFHPEKPVQSQVDPAAFGRNYFTRASAPEHLTADEAQEREAILAECMALKQYADFHFHPEKPVATTDSMACARNYFTRASADEYFDDEAAEERELILKEAGMLKQYADFHFHPEKPVQTTDATICGRNFFTRASAEEYLDEEEAEERELILAECMALKTVAGYHFHPERPVESHGDGTSFGRNFFGRASAPEKLMFHEAHERAAILADAAMLKQYAGYHLHPERPVESQADATSFGRNFFGRASAPDQLMFHEAHERATILEEAAMLKQYAGYHFHPERPVETTDYMACARNYFTRASAHIDADLITSEGRANSVAGEQMVDESDYGFELDEDLHDLHDFRASLTKLVGERLDDTQPIKTVAARSDEGEEQEGNLSRSPSSIMLFGYEENAY
eukprot:CAMPEP_0119006256 /NCGR_PEP_ID=MMETSP1176-20130426/2191_1 /TAXON_ID=265551 /ORGANISM="Synedropsis recta cf, Strain CCMP1620" /LENGTH=624 /DNA_ID=CAMNT_0006958155 /DNA_START=118 /DNA_END=1992 /DNA_ORIENTATION=-